jgi:hypothetical protein
MEWEVKLIKLISGETVISHIKYDKLKKHAVLKDPLAFTLINKPSGVTSLVATKWMETRQKVFTIKTYHVILTVDPSEMMHKLYLESVEEMGKYETANAEDSEETPDTKWDDLVDYMETLEEEDSTLH